MARRERQAHRLREGQLAGTANAHDGISNWRPRVDSGGKILDAHDGCLQKFGDRYYLYGTAYGTTDGFNKNNRYRCYSSADLVTWKFEGELLEDPPDGVYYRPYVVFNKSTGKYVLWYNWYATLWNGQYGVATSDTPQGPFVIQNDNVKVANGKPGDLNLLVDDDGSAYLIYTSIADKHSISIEKPASDYLSSTLQNRGFLASGCEAPALFKRQKRYYALFDKCCCFCSEGSGAQVWVAEKQWYLTRCAATSIATLPANRSATPRLTNTSPTSTHASTSTMPPPPSAKPIGWACCSPVKRADNARSSNSQPPRPPCVYGGG
jgi:hypothetical protein